MTDGPTHRARELAQRYGLTSAEALRLHSSDPLLGALSEEQVRAALRVADANADGQISPEELQAYKDTMTRVAPGADPARLARIVGGGVAGRAQALVEELRPIRESAARELDGARQALADAERAQREGLAVARQELGVVAEPSEGADALRALRQRLVGAQDAPGSRDIARRETLRRELARAEERMQTTQRAVIWPGGDAVQAAAMVNALETRLAAGQERLRRAPTDAEHAELLSVRQSELARVGEQLASPRLHAANRRHLESRREELGAEVVELSSWSPSVELQSINTARGELRALRQQIHEAERGERQIPALEQRIRDARLHLAPLDERAELHRTAVERLPSIDAQIAFAEARERLQGPVDDARLRLDRAVRMSGSVEREATTADRLLETSATHTTQALIEQAQAAVARLESVHAAERPALQVAARELSLTGTVERFLREGRLSESTVNRPALAEWRATQFRQIDRSSTRIEAAAAPVAALLNDPAFAESLATLPSDRRRALLLRMSEAVATTDVGRRDVWPQVERAMLGAPDAAPLWRHALSATTAGSDNASAMLMAWHESIASKGGEEATDLLRSAVRTSGLETTGHAFTAISGSIAVFDLLRSEDPQVRDIIDGLGGASSVNEAALAQLGARVPSFERFARIAGGAAGVLAGGAGAVVGAMDLWDAASHADGAGVVGNYMVTAGGVLAMNAWCPPLTLVGGAVAGVGTAIDWLGGDSSAERWMKAHTPHYLRQFNP